jgi:MerR family transcriptional regulator, activator of bmr gene
MEQYMKNNLLYSIGQVARTKNITVKTLRYYHEIGLLIPEKINPENGYRYYSSNQMLILDIINVAKNTNAPLETIKEIVDSFSISNLMSFIDQQRKELDKKLVEIKNMHDLLNRVTEALKNNEENFPLNDLKIIKYPKRYAFSMPLDTKLLNADIEAHSKILCYLKEKGIKPTFITGTIIEGNLIKNNSKAVFHIIDKRFFKKNNNNFIVLEAGKYLTTTYRSNEISKVIKILSKFINDKKIKFKQFIEIDLFDNITNNDKLSSNIQIFIG